MILTTSFFDMNQKIEDINGKKHCLMRPAEDAVGTEKTFPVSKILEVVLKFEKRKLFDLYHYVWLYIIKKDNFQTFSRFQFYVFKLYMFMSVTLGRIRKTGQLLN